MSEIDTQHTAAVSGGAAEPDRPQQAEPWLRFALVFGTLAVTSEVLYYAVTLDSVVFQAYLGVLADVSGTILAWFSSDIVVRSARITGPAFVVEIAQGCDAVQVCSLLAAAVIAFPMSLMGKLRGLVFGIVFLQLLNIVRIITLYWIGAHFSSIFKTAHEVIWPGFLIFATIATWIVWVRLETRLPQSKNHAA
ncbi:MAG: exosortase H [Myxococcota bacterium]